MGITVKHYKVINSFSDGSSIVSKDVGWEVTKNVTIVKKQKINGKFEVVKTTDLGDYTSVSMPSGNLVEEVTEEVYDALDTSNEKEISQKRRARNEKFVTVLADRIDVIESNKGKPTPVRVVT